MHDCGVKVFSGADLVPQAEIQLLTPKCPKLDEMRKNSSVFLVYFVVLRYTGYMSELQKIEKYINTQFRRLQDPFLIIFIQSLLTYGGRWDCAPSI